MRAAVGRRCVAADVAAGPRYTALFARLVALPHAERLRTPYFEGLETPGDIAARVVEAAAAAARGGGGGPVLLVTHSTVLEAVLAACFGKNFEGIKMRTLAWIRYRFGDDGTLQLLETDGVEFCDGVAPR